ncbi:biotin/lipoyl-containing protein [Malikia spinosa]
MLASIEAMKMESLVLAEREATVKAIHVRHGDAVPAKALLMELAD